MNYQKKKVTLLVIMVLLYSTLATSTLVYAQDKQEEEGDPNDPQEPKPPEEEPDPQEPKPPEEEPDPQEPKPEPQEPSTATITITPSLVSVGQRFIVTGTGYANPGIVEVRLDSILLTPEANIPSPASPGTWGFELWITMPSVSPQLYTVTATMEGETATADLQVAARPSPVSRQLTLSPAQGEPGTSVTISKDSYYRLVSGYEVDLTVYIGSTQVALDTTMTPKWILSATGDIGQITVPDIDSGEYTVEAVFELTGPNDGTMTWTGSFFVLEDPEEPTQPTEPTTTESPWDHLTAEHVDLGSFGDYVQDMDAQLEGWFQPGGSIYQIVAETNSYTSQIDWSDLARIESEILAIQTLCQDIPTGISQEQIQEILDAIDALELQFILDTLNDDTKFTDDAELSLLRQELLDAVYSMDPQSIVDILNEEARFTDDAELIILRDEILNAVSSIDLQSIIDALEDDTRYTDDDELAQLQNMIADLSTTVSSLMDSHGLAVASRFTGIESDLDNLASRMATEQQVRDLETQIMGILGDEANFVSDAELDSTIDELTGVLTTTLGDHSDLILAEIQALDWTPIVETYVVVQAIQGDMNANFASLNTRMDTFESLLLEAAETPDCVGVEIEKADSKSYYILTTLNGQPHSAELTITVGGKAVATKDHSVSEIATGLYGLEFKGKAGKNKGPILAVARIDVDGESIYASTIQVLQ